MTNPHQLGEGPFFRTDIQGLRALAVVFVVLYHAQVPLFSGGYVGVDVFFVISGYLITGLLMRETERCGSIDFAAFYARRIRRLLPAALLVLVITALAARVLLSPLEQREMVPSLLFSALYSSNLWFASQATDYLASDVHTNPLLHTWSLSVEEQFYLAWPLLILLAAKAGRADRTKTRLVWAMTAVLAISLAASLWLTVTAHAWAFFGSPTRAWEFATGGLAFMAQGRMAALSRRIKDVLAATGLALMFAAVLLFDNTTPFPGWAALLPVAGAGLVVSVGAGPQGRVSRLFMHSAWQVVGNLSYSWYLWHWPVLGFQAVLWGSSTLPVRMLWVAVSLALAAVTYHFVENPVRFSAALAVRPLRSFAVGMLLTAVGTGSALGLRALAKDAMASSQQARFEAVRSDLPRIYSEGCHLPYAVESFPACVYGDQFADRIMVLFGDSHAAQWFPALERVATEMGWRLISLTKSACPSAMVTPHNAALARPYRECAAWQARVLKRIAAERPTVVVLGNSSRYLRDPSEGIDAQAWREGMARTLAGVRQAGATAMIVRDTPEPGFDVPVCLSRAAWREQGDAACRFERRNALDSRVVEIDRAAAQGMDHVSLVDLSDMLCDRSECRAAIEGRVAYRDTHHLTTAVSARLAPALRERLVAALESHPIRTPSPLPTQTR